MIVLEAVAFAIVAGFVLVRARYGPAPRAFLERIGLLVVASWIVEDSCIRAYGFYHYSPQWSLFIDHVPLAILLIWPIVIHSAWELAGHLLGRGHSFVPLIGGAMVLTDASMIEPIAVNSGLWSWTEPGVFDVPPIGVIGWAYYAGLCMVVFERNRSAGRRTLLDAATLLLAPVGTHLLLLASWWGLFRWISTTIDPWPVVVGGWVLSAALTVHSLRVGARRRVPPRDILARVPAALFFFALVALHARDAPALVAFALAFAPPYLSLTRLRGGVTSSTSSPEMIGPPAA